MSGINSDVGTRGSSSQQPCRLSQTAEQTSDSHSGQTHRTAQTHIHTEKPDIQRHTPDRSKISIPNRHAWQTCQLKNTKIDHLCRDNQYCKSDSVINKWGWPDSSQPSHNQIDANTPLWSAKSIFPAQTKFHTLFSNLFVLCPLWPTFLPLTLNV